VPFMLRRITLLATAALVMKRLVTTFIAALVGSLALAGIAWADQTPALGWNWACEPVGSAVAVDPIASFGVEPTAHLHQPFCTSMESTLTLSELRAQPNNAKWAANPDNPTNAKNLDWIPAPVFLNNRDAFVPVPHVNYYFRKAPNVPVSAVVPPPRGLKVIVGSPDASGAQAHIGWRCGLTSDSFFSPTQPDCGNKNLKLVVVFPSCSNGEANSADHKSHLRWPGETGCPDSHPIAIPQMRLEWSLDTNGERVAFLDRSGKRIAPHADFFNGTPSAVWEDVIERCLDNPRSVGGCAGTGLEGVTNEEFGSG
jgi:hypothetical protein